MYLVSTASYGSKWATMFNTVEAALAFFWDIVVTPSTDEEFGVTLSKDITGTISQLTGEVKCGEILVTIKYDGYYIRGHQRFTDYDAANAFIQDLANYRRRNVHSVELILDKQWINC